jgi:hypothetical protein
MKNLNPNLSDAEFELLCRYVQQVRAQRFATQVKVPNDQIVKAYDGKISRCETGAYKLKDTAHSIREQSGLNRKRGGAMQMQFYAGTGVGASGNRA